MDSLQIIDQKCEEEKRLYDSIFDLLSYEKITFNGKIRQSIIYCVTVSVIYK